MLQPLRERDFALLWAGMAVSLLGDGIYFVAIAWQAYDLSNSPSSLAFVGAAYTGGMVALLLAGGVVSDRLPRRRVMMGADAARALVLGAVGALSLTGALQLWMLVALVALYGGADAFFMPAFGALVPEIVPAPMLVQANAIEHAVRNLASRIAGPAVGGGAVALLGTGGSFVLDASTFLVSFACLAALRVHEVPAPSGTGVLREVKAGLTYVRSQTWLWATLVAASVTLLVFYGPTEVLVPFVIRNDLGGGAGGFGLFLAASGVGWLAGSAWMGHREMPRRPMTFLYLWWGIGAFPVCAFALATQTWHLMGLGMLVGLASAVGTVVWGTLMQTRVPRELRGRVNSLDWLVSIGLTPVSFALTGPVAAGIGVDATLVGAGALGGALTLALLFLLPGLRERRDVVAEAGVGDLVGLHADDLDALATGHAGDGADHG
jgi:DHA3 family tetracycline resistance protein-like MFS transporter